MGRIRFEPLSHTDKCIHSETDALIELDCSSITSSCLEVDLGTSGCTEKLLGVVHDACGMAFPLFGGSHGRVVDPAAMPLVTGHTACDDSSVVFANQKPFRIHG